MQVQSDPPISPRNTTNADAVPGEVVEVMADGQEEEGEGAPAERTVEPDEVDGDEFESGERGQKRILPDPGQPTTKQMEEHRITGHAVYRSWCPFCVAACATGEQHRSRPEERSISRVSFDYLFTTKSAKVLTKAELQGGEEVELKVLVAKDSSTKSIFAHVVPQKGSDDEGYAVGRLVEDVRWLGHTKLELKTDTERAILKLLTDSLVSLRFEVGDADQLQDERAVPYDSQTNGDAENAVKQVQKRLRTLKLDLEARIQKRIPNKHPVLTWLV